VVLGGVPLAWAVQKHNHTALYRLEHYKDDRVARFFTRRATAQDYLHVASVSALANAHAPPPCPLPWIVGAWWGVCGWRAGWRAQLSSSTAGGALQSCPAPTPLLSAGFEGGLVAFVVCDGVWGVCVWGGGGWRCFSVSGTPSASHFSYAMYACDDWKGSALP
jgi:hypothetical protein